MEKVDIEKNITLCVDTWYNLTHGGDANINNNDNL